MSRDRRQGSHVRRKDLSDRVVLSKHLNEAREEAIQICGKVCYRLRAQQVLDQKEEQTGNRRYKNKSLAEGWAWILAYHQLQLKCQKIFKDKEDLKEWKKFFSSIHRQIPGAYIPRLPWKSKTWDSKLCKKNSLKKQNNTKQNLSYPIINWKTEDRLADTHFSQLPQKVTKVTSWPLEGPYNFEI